MSFASIGRGPASAHQVHVNAATSYFDTDFAGGTLAYVPRAWMELVASTPVEAAQFDFMIMTGTNGERHIDIAIGAAGSEHIIVEKWRHNTRIDGDIVNIVSRIPVRIPKGVRVAYRWTGNFTGNTSTAAWASLLPKSPWIEQGGSRMVTFGITTNDFEGTSVDHGASNHVFGSWSEIVASTPAPLCGIRMSVRPPVAGAYTTVINKIYEIGIGASGSEVPLFNAGFPTRGNHQTSAPTYSGFTPCSIPAGTRLSVRMQCSDITRDTSDSLVHLHGIVP